MHHVCRILEHLVGQIEGALLVDVIGRGALANVHIPETQHLITSHLDLCLTITSCNRRAVRRLIITTCTRYNLTIIEHRYITLGRLGSIVLHFCTIEVLCVCRWLALTDRFGYFARNILCYLLGDHIDPTTTGH